MRTSAYTIDTAHSFMRVLLQRLIWLIGDRIQKNKQPPQGRLRRLLVLVNVKRYPSSAGLAATYSSKP